MKTKASSTVGVLFHHSILHAAEVVDRTWRRVTGAHAVVTGLGEEGHSETSLHYGVVGDIRTRAMDFRARDLTPEERHEIDAELHRRLGEGEFDIVWERLDTPTPHLHVEVDPK